MKNKNLTTIYLVRHGETEWNLKRLIQGHSDSPLTKAGIEQAKKVAKNLKKIKFDLVFSSDLLRAKKTAEIIAAKHDLEVETSNLLRERAFGSYEGKPHNALAAFDKLFESLKEEEKFKYKSSPEIESDEEITTRLINFLRKALISHPEKTILVVTHGGIMRAFLIRLGFGTYKALGTRKALGPGAIANTAHVKLESDGIDFFIKETGGIKHD